jgi:hypothetical protein
VDPLFAWMEQLPVSTWLREADTFFAFPAVLTVHVISLGLVVGTCVAMDLRALGFLPGIPPRSMDRFMSIVWIAFVFVVASGVLLVLTYPIKNLTNPLFYFKLACVAFGLWVMVRIDRRVLMAPQADGTIALGNPRALAIASIVVWAAAISSGRFLAYTCTRLMVDFGKCP